MKLGLAALRWLILLVILLKFWAITSSAGLPEVDYPKLKEVYQHSQYNLDRGFEYWGMMPDNDLYTYSALAYLRGADPGELNFEHPPLGKYLLGLSLVLFGNPLLVQFLAGAGTLWLTFLFARRLNLFSPFDLIPPALLVFDRLFGEYLISVNLEMIHLFFILLCLYWLIAKPKGRRGDWRLGLAIGAALTTKGVFNGLLVFFFILLVKGFGSRKFRPGFYLQTGFTALGVYFISYGVFFLKHNFGEFIQLHLKILRFYRSYLPDYPWLEIFRVLIVGRWRTWFAEPLIQPVTSFWIFWPLAALATLFSAVQSLIRRASPGTGAELILSAWVALYLVYASTHLVFPRYLLPILPPIYLILSAVSYRFWERLRKKSIRKAGRGY